MPCAYLRGALDWGSSACKLWGGRAVAPPPQNLLAASNLASLPYAGSKGIQPSFFQ